MNPRDCGKFAFRKDQCNIQGSHDSASPFLNGDIGHNVKQDDT